MLPKASLVSLGVHDDVLNWMAKYRPVSLILVNERGQSRPERPWENNEIDGIRRAMDASPKTLWILRSWPDGIGEGDKMALGFRMIRCFEPFMDMPNPKMGHSYNEPGFLWIGASGAARELMYLEEDFARHMHNAGLLSMNFCFSESHILKGNMGLWKIFAEALPCVDALGFNEYDWPSVFTSRDQGYKWRIGHWEHQYEAIRKVLKRNEAIPPVIIGEGILDGKIWTGALPEGDPMRGKPCGYQKAGNRPRPTRPQEYVRMHQQAHDETYHRPEVFSHHTFCYCHPSSEWRSYSVEPILEDLGELIQEQVYWEDFVYPRVNTPEIPNNDDQQNGSNDQENGSMEQPIRVLTEASGVITMELEEYLRGVLPREMGVSAHPEALMAQAVAARCYAMKAIKSPRHAPDADVCDGTHCQVYGKTSYPETDRAIEGTKGIVATYNSKVINAFYFGHCDGRTRNCEDVWIQALPYCRSVPCICGYDSMYGHGVGMCQRGAMKMAENGAGYKEILRHYYTGCEVDGEKAPEKPNPIQLAIKKIESAQATQKAAHEASMRDLDDAKEGLLEWVG